MKEGFCASIARRCAELISLYTIYLAAEICQKKVSKKIKRTTDGSRLP